MIFISTNNNGSNMFFIEQISPSNQILLVYLFITGVLIITLNKDKEIILRTISLRFIIGVVLFLLVITTLALPYLTYITELLPLIVLPAIYSELKVACKSIYKNTFDDKIQDIEYFIFRCQPSIVLSQRLNNRLLSDFFHSIYFTYYFIIYLCPFYLLYNNMLTEFSHLVTLITLIMYSCYLLQIVTPVSGPRYEFKKIESKNLQSRIFKLTHKLLEKGSSKGTALPSAHVALVNIVFLFFLQNNFTNLYLLSIVVTCWIGTIIGVVYCRFHYVIDVIYGMIISSIIYLIFCFTT